ncbi:alkene reductase [Xanthomonas hyacinthi]|uniref:Alkene reductase n=1 Tax=Xanthomonas hyacinthi TaxID=56455 RepID=A0A2S7EXG5_9XANT|nr:alkene reductase [Xanthomonas hyacinthi]KLD74858.1 NADH:flavin oxidoreductase [Xanthomonas hyacinthi DSM 19077]PPU97852.1 alkene reductase [Xanthomonas hyacinthi]QGY76627.1 alkene reductase [Xanthomonas hyacinthi]
MSQLFASYDLPGRTLRNRIVMAPMTRSRSEGFVANMLNARYYQQRASAGLIITEGTPVSPQGQGYAAVPALYSDAQIAGWNLVTDAVHEASGSIFAQLWHVGRMSHASLQPGGGAPVGPSDQSVERIPGNRVFIDFPDGGRGPADPTPPRALSSDEIPAIETDFVSAAYNAINAGFDGVEIHAANGYLLEQFLNADLNGHEDRYGGTIENRARLILETVDNVAAGIGAEKVGIRLSPRSQLFVPDYQDNEATYLYLAAELGKRGLAYVHLVDNRVRGESVLGVSFLKQFKAAYRGTVILAGGLTRESAIRLIDAGLIDLAAFGQPFIANPDLVDRFQRDLPPATPDPATYYDGGEQGYTDYPVYAVPLD